MTDLFMGYSNFNDLEKNSKKKNIIKPHDKLVNFNVRRGLLMNLSRKYVIVKYVIEAPSDMALESPSSFAFIKSLKYLLSSPSTWG